MGFEIINKLKKEKGLTNAQLAELSGVTLSTLDKITSGVNKNPKLDTLQAICRALGCRLDDFDDYEPNVIAYSKSEIELINQYRELDEHGKSVVDAVVEKEIERLRVKETPKTNNKVIPLFLTPAAAGYASPALGEDYEEYISSNDKADFAVRISGDSMMPYIEDGSVVEVKKQLDLEPGDVGMFFVDGDMLCKQYCEDAFGNIYLFSLNRDRKDADRVILASSGTSVFCFGKVILPIRPPLPRD